jgi:hypothetical protein
LNNGASPTASPVQAAPHTAGHGAGKAVEAGHAVFGAVAPVGILTLYEYVTNVLTPVHTSSGFADLVTSMRG